MRQDLFFTRFYIFENIYDNKILSNILNTIKVDMDSLSNVAAEPDGGPDYRTNYYVHGDHRARLLLRRIWRIYFRWVVTENRTDRRAAYWA